MAPTSWWDAVLTGGSGHVRSGRHDGVRYLVLPKGDPRVAVDAGNRTALADTLRRYGSTKLSQLAGGVAAPLAVALPYLGPVWTVDADDGLRHALSEVLERSVDLAIAVGPPRVNRKPVIRCYDGDRIIAYAKLGPDPHTAQMVRNEAAWLAAFTEQPLTSASTPRVLHAGSFGEHPLLVTEPLDLPDAEPVAPSSMPTSVLHELARRSERGRGLSTSAWWRRIEAELTGAPEWADEFGPALATVQGAPGAESLEWSTWHGDWSPWNVGVDRAGRQCVWDWERTETGAPTGLDIVHLHYQYGAGLSGADEPLDAAGFDPEHRALLPSLYLLEMMCRHHAAGRPDADTARMDRAALSACVAGLGGDHLP